MMVEQIADEKIMCVRWTYPERERDTVLTNIVL